VSTQSREYKSIGSGLENRDYSHRGSAALTTRHPSIHKSLHQLRRQAAVAQLVKFAHRLRPQSFFSIFGYMSVILGKEFLFKLSHQPVIVGELHN
jgi:hypothetical protein